jgi:hypothetical protein
MADVCDLGNCTNTHTINSRYIYEDKIFPVEDAVMLMRDMWAQTQILSHQNLDGEVSFDGGDDEVFVTFHEDVKPGFKKRLYRDRILSTGWYSKANGYSCTECGFVGGSTKRQVEIDTYICTTCIRQEEDICMNEFLGTWKMTSLARGMMRQSEEIFISDDIYYAFERANYELVDKHFWHGDYKSADSSVMHVDGLIKQAVRALDNEKPAIYSFTFTGLDATNALEGLIGGQEFIVPWDTDLATTLGAFETELESYNDANGVALFSDVTVASNVVTVTTQPGMENPLQFVITNYSAPNGSGFKLCRDGSIQANEAVTSGATVAWLEVQEAAGGNAPIGIDFEKVTSNNVLAKFEELYHAIQEKKAVLLDQSFGGTLFVSPNVWVAMKMALKKENAHFVGTQGDLPEVRDVYGFRRIVKANYLGRDHMIYFRAADVHVATDLLDDITEIKTGYDPKCETAWFKNKFAFGVKVSEFSNIAGTFCMTDNFGAEMPCEVDQS